jgi:hypothetical protein
MIKDFLHSLLIALLGLGCALTCMICLFFIFHVDGQLLFGCSFFYGLVMVGVYSSFREEVRKQNEK